MQSKDLTNLDLNPMAYLILTLMATMQYKSYSFQQLANNSKKKLPTNGHKVIDLIFKLNDSSKLQLIKFNHLNLH